MRSACIQVSTRELGGLTQQQFWDDRVLGSGSVNAFGRVGGRHGGLADLAGRPGAVAECCDVRCALARPGGSPRHKPL